MTKEELQYGYFSNTLTSEEFLLLEDLLKNDLEFKEEFLFEKNLKKMIGHQKKQDLKSKLNDYESRRLIGNKPVEIKPKTSKFRYYSIAAMLLVFLTAGWFAYNTVYGINYMDLYNDNYQTFPNTVFEITRSDMDDSLERRAFVDYESGNYKQAIEKFETIPNRDYSDFYLAQSYTHLQKLGKAKILYKKIIAEKGQFVAEAHWYVAMIYLKEEDKKSAKTYLNDLVVNYDYNKTKAQKILKKLD